MRDKTTTTAASTPASAAIRTDDVTTYVPPMLAVTPFTSATISVGLG
ncbi:hypothetical protein AB0C81_19715 [Streptomyces roseoverticillatus]